jgi:hypothetical protein
MPDAPGRPARVDVLVDQRRPSARVAHVRHQLPHDFVVSSSSSTPPTSGVDTATRTKPPTADEAPFAPQAYAVRVTDALAG